MTQPARQVLVEAVYETPAGAEVLWSQTRTGDLKTRTTLVRRLNRPAGWPVDQALKPMFLTYVGLPFDVYVLVDTGLKGNTEGMVEGAGRELVGGEREGSGRELETSIKSSRFFSLYYKRH